MKIKVRSLNGKKAMIEVEEKDTILHVLLLAEPHKAFQSELLYQGRRLEKFCTIEYYKIVDGDHLQIVDASDPNCSSPENCVTN
ncbi:unnamed protein product, partial [Mesorhabditis belari]|uniref:Ubiquitin-like domain-containing protein n=1 Tax=Mesorhabditis belari TaxID=2138241 RepID=A0AAF3EFR8_9BILA